MILGYLIKQIFLSLAVQQSTGIAADKIIGLNHVKRVSFVSLPMYSMSVYKRYTENATEDSMTKKEKKWQMELEQMIRIHLFKR